MHINSSEYEIANPASTRDDRMKEMLKKIHLWLIIIQGNAKKYI